MTERLKLARGLVCYVLWRALWPFDWWKYCRLQWTILPYVGDWAYRREVSEMREP